MFDVMCQRIPNLRIRSEHKTQFWYTYQKGVLDWINRFLQSLTYILL
jgi:hypothetical protein